MIQGLRATSSTIQSILTGTTSISSGSTVSTSTHVDFDITVTGANVGAHVFLVPQDNIDNAVGGTGSKITWSAWVSATNTVTVKITCAAYCGSAYTVSGTWRYLVVNF